ncbi:MAG: alkaline phosphatase PhoX [Acidimicrobiales bacterium]
MTDLDARGNGRRSFLKGAGAAAGAASLLGFEAVGRTVAAGATPFAAGSGGYGPLRPTKDQTTGEELIALPRGFEYLTFGRTGDLMDDGIATPSNHDGMGAFRVGDLVHLVRNHERGAGAAFASGMTYNAGAGGGNTTLVFDPDQGQLVSAHASLAGTIRNCAGGITPWGTWLSCEETTLVVGGMRHGYVFEVPAVGTASGAPLPGLGRFSHEAAAVDPATGIVYLTEDATPSGLYRFVPTVPGNLAAGGQLQMLAIGDGAVQTYGDTGPRDYGQVSWVDIAVPDPAPGAMATVFQGIAGGGASFERGEGIWYSPVDGKVYFVSTSGGPSRGQVFELDPATDELRLIFHSPSLDVLDSPDNICVSPQGSLLLCEDGSDQEYLHGLTTDGQIFRFAENLINGSEWAGACFEPKNGAWLFVSLQSPGITFAITGPWGRGPL